ncbi:long-chain-fatty-acid--CoA ligase 1-like, partial [Saccoglossus kowalevskii]
MPSNNTKVTPEEAHLRKVLGLPSKINVRLQSVQLPGNERIHVNPMVKGKPLVESFFPGVNNLHDVFKHGIKLSDNGPCLGYRPSGTQPYYWVTYEHVYDRAKRFGAGLISTGCPVGQNSHIGIYSQNRIGWNITEQACYMYSMVTVALYDTLGIEACTHIINQCEMTTVICDVVKKAHTLLDVVDKTPSLKRIVVMDRFSDEDVQAAKQKQVELLAFRDVEIQGENNPHDLKCPSPEDTATICYTSGTTGLPKGAILTHSNYLAVISAWMTMKGVDVVYSPSDVYISYLPLAHVYERFVQAVLFLHGCKIGYFRGDVKTLMDDIKELRPTFLCLVPRLMNRIYDKIMSGVAAKSWLVRRLFFFALKRKEMELQKGIIRNNGIWDSFFKKMRQSLGGRVKTITSGAAPISPQIMTFCRAVFGCIIMEGYGQTECTCVTSISLPTDTSAGHVGCIVPCFEVKLEDVPEMEYFAAKNQGEICMRGPGVFKGYYKDPAKTAETIDKNGWLHSGDIGQWLSRGELKVIDRKKHIFKLAQGEYIAPEKIENVY